MKYSNLLKESSSIINTRNIDIDKAIHADNSEWKGLSLIIRPSAGVANRMHDFIKIAKNDFGNQLYCGDCLHITVLEIFACQPSLDFDNIDLPSYIDCIETSIKEIKNFRIHFTGITSSTSCIMARGHPDSTELSNMRDKIRVQFSKSNLSNTIDSRYKASLAHCTLIRFKEKLHNIETFNKIIKEYELHNYGTCRVYEIELVTGNWSLSKNKTQILHTFTLREN